MTVSGMRMGGRLGNGHAATMVGRAERPNWTWRIAPVRSPLPNHKGCSMLALGERARGCGPGNGDAERQGCDPTGSRKAATGLDECRQTTDRPQKTQSGAEGARTLNLRIANAALSQLSYRPNWITRTPVKSTVPRRSTQGKMDGRPPWPISSRVLETTCPAPRIGRPIDERIP